MKKLNIRVAMLALLTSVGLHAQPPGWTTEEAVSDHFFKENIGQVHDWDGTLATDVLYHGGDAVRGIFFLDVPKVAHLQRNSATRWSCRVDIVFDCGFGEEIQCGNISAFDVTDEKGNYYDDYIPDGVLDIDMYKGILIDDAFTDIDIIYSSNSYGVVTYYEIGTTASPGDIRLKFEGQSGIDVLDDGHILVNTMSGDMVFNQLEAFQLDIATNTLTPLGWKPDWVLNGDVATLQNFGGYDITQKLYFIDAPDIPPANPVLIANDASGWSTRYGGGSIPSGNPSHEEGGTIRVDKTTKDIYHTMVRPKDNLFPVQNGNTCDQKTGGGGKDIYITKFEHTSYKRLWSTYFGGAGDEFCSKMALSYNSASDYIYLTGYVKGGDLPMPSSNQGTFVQATNNGQKDAFVASFDKASGFRQWVTHFGGQQNDEGMSISVDDVDHKLYITGYTITSNVSATCNTTSSGNFPLCQGGGRYYQNSYGGTFDEQAFVAEFDIDQNYNTLEWSTLFGGDKRERAFDVVKVNNNGEKSLYIAGITLSEYSGISAPAVSSPITSPAISGDFPFVNPGGSTYFQYGNNTAGDQEAFIAKFDNTFKLAWSSHFGGAGAEQFSSLAVNSTNDIYAVGVSNTVNTNLGTSNNLAVNDVYWPTYKPSPTYTFHQNQVSGASDPLSQTLDVMITRFNSSGQLKWSTYFGGGAYERSYFGLLEEGNIVTSKVDIYDNLYIYGTSLHRKNPAQVSPVSIPIKTVVSGMHGNYYNQATNASNEPGEVAPYGNDAFISVFNKTYNAHAYSTYFGGRAKDGSPNILGMSDEIANDFDVVDADELFITGKQATQGTPFHKPADPAGYSAKFDLYLGDWSCFITNLHVEPWWTSTGGAMVGQQNPNEDKTAIVSPNPLGQGADEVTVEIESETTVNAKVYIYDMLGRTYYSEDFTLVKGSNQLPLDISKANMAQGMYSVKITGENLNKNIMLLVK